MILTVRTSLLSGLLCFTVLHFSSNSLAAEHRESIETTVGVEGEYFFRYPNNSLEAVSVDEKSSLVLRIADVVQDGDTLHYEVRYIGRRPGTYDLRDFLVRVDGQTVDNLPPMQVTVLSVLPEVHSGEMKPMARTPLPIPWRYRLLMAALIVLWLSPIAYLIIKKLLRKKEIEALEATSPPTLADQLRPLVESAIRGELQVTEKSQLELMLMTYWREKLEIAGCQMAEAVQSMREHDDARILLDQLETWFHRPHGTTQSVDVAQVLEPYREHAPIDIDQLEQAEARV